MGNEASSVTTSEAEELASSENADLKSKLAYCMADFINYKKRAEQEKAKAAVAAVEDFAKDLFPHIDNFDTVVRSLKAIGNSNQQFEAGIDLVVGGIMHVLKAHGFEKVQIAVGDAFDVNTCEAVLSEESDLEKDSITQVFSSGWKHNGKVICPAKVAVAK